MAATIKVIGILLFLGLISQCYSQCSISDLSLRQSQTGAKVEGKPEWGVTITNNCPCVQKNVVLNCKGFQTVEHIDPSILSVQDEYCLVKAGQPIYKDAVTFRYAWDTSFPLNPIHSEIDCAK